MKKMTCATMAFGLALLIGFATPASAAKKKQVKKAKVTVSRYDKAKKICLQENSHLEGKLLQACIKKKKAQLKKK